MGKKSQEHMVEKTFDERCQAAKIKQEEKTKKLDEASLKPAPKTINPRQNLPNVDVKPEDVIEAKIAKNPQMTFRQKVDMMRDKRRRASHRRHDEADHPELLKTRIDTGAGIDTTIREEEPKIRAILGATNYQCKDCKTRFIAFSDENQCIACGSKKIEIVENDEK